ncbi:hypothetical protein PAMA110636_01115 [Paenibacillus macerans]
MKTSRLYVKQPFVISLLVLLILETIVTGIGIGSSPVSYGRLIPTILGHGSFEDQFVLFSIRLPRILITLLAGMALALSGAILQGITRNELADPGIVGINSGAGVGVTVFFIFAPIDVASFVYMIPLMAFAGALATAVLIYAFSYTRSNGVQPIRLIITGVGFSMALSGMMIVLISSVDRTKVDFISKWLAGNVWGTDWPFALALAIQIQGAEFACIKRAQRYRCRHGGPKRPYPSDAGGLGRFHDRRDRVYRPDGSAYCQSFGWSTASAICAGVHSNRRLAAASGRYDGPQLNSAGRYRSRNHGCVYRGPLFPLSFVKKKDGRRRRYVSTSIKASSTTWA